MTPEAFFLLLITATELCWKEHGTGALTVVSTPDYLKIDDFVPYGEPIPIPTNISLSAIHNLILSYRADGEVHVYFIGVNDQTVYEFVFGIGSTTIGLKLLPLAYGSPYNVTAPAGEVVTGTNQANWAWICWQNGTMSTGLGQVIGRNVKLMYLDKNPMKINTFSVAGYSGVHANWTIFYNQFRDPSSNATDLQAYLPDAVKGSAFCKDVDFPSLSSLDGMVDLGVNLLGRSSIIFEMNSLQPIPMNISLFSSENIIYTLRFIASGIRFYRNIALLGLVVPKELLPGQYWISWKNGQLAFGTGQIPGNGTFVMINVQTEQQMTNISISALNGSFAVPLPYYISNKVFERTFNPTIQKATFRKVATNKCVYSCSIGNLADPSCSLFFCSRACSEARYCTSFCIHPPQNIASSQSCTCELLAIPAAPASDQIYRDEVGASYWEMVF